MTGSPVVLSAPVFPLYNMIRRIQEDFFNAAAHPQITMQKYWLDYQRPKQHGYDSVLCIRAISPYAP